ncbi:hypothetical protein ABK040_015586 [Willaertia magna]
MSTTRKISKPIGIEELLTFSSKTVGRTCKSIMDLKDGSIFLMLFKKIWPKVKLLSQTNWFLKPKNEKEINANWELIKDVIQSLDLPLQVCQKKEIMKGDFSSCYNFLVMCYFLKSLSEQHDFSVDFSHPISPYLASFLQSKASVETLVKGGAISLESIKQQFNDWDYDEQLSLLSETQSVVSTTTSTRWNIDANMIDEVLELKASTPIIDPQQPKMVLKEIDNELTEERLRSWEEQMLNSEEEQNVYPQKTNNISNPSLESVSESVQTVLTGGKLEKILFRNMKARREIDDLKHMLEESYELIEELKSNNNNNSSSDIYNLNEDVKTEVFLQNVAWKSEQKKLKGELLLTKMRYELESLNRQLNYVKQEKEQAIKKYEKQITELKTTHEKEMMYYKDSIKGKETSQQLNILVDKLKDQTNYTLELQRIKDEIAFEADKIRQGGLHLEDDESIEDEILRLRQLKVTLMGQNKSLEENNNSLKEIIETLQGNLRQEQERINKIHEHYLIQDKEIMGDAKSILKDLEESSNVDKDILLNGELSRRERILAIKLQKLEDDLQLLTSKYNTETEQLKYELFKHQQKPGELKDSISTEFDLEQKIERLESEVQRLKRTNNYLRERSVVFDKHNSSKSTANASTSEESQLDKNVWIPLDYIGEKDNEDNTNSELNQLIRHTKEIIEKGKTLEVLNVIGNLEKLFWKLITDQNIYQQRIRKAGNQIYRLHTQSTKLQETLNKQKLEFEQQLEKSNLQFKNTVEDIELNFQKEKASLLVKLQLTESDLQNTRELNAFSEGNSHLFELAFSNDQKRFYNLFNKLKQCKALVSAYDLKENIWTQLIDCQRRNIDVTEQLALLDANSSKHEDLIQEKEKLDIEAASYVQQLEALTNQSNTEYRDMPKEEIENIVKEATRVLFEQAKQEKLKTEKLLKEKSDIIDNIRNLESKMKDFELELDKEKKGKDSARNDLKELMKEKSKKEVEYHELKESHTKKVLELEKVIQDLRQQIEEMRTYSTSYSFVGSSPTISYSTTIHTPKTTNATPNTFDSIKSSATTINVSNSNNTSREVVTSTLPSVVPTVKGNVNTSNPYGTNYNYSAPNLSIDLKKNYSYTNTNLPPSNIDEFLTYNNNTKQ